MHFRNLSYTHTTYDETNLVLSEIYYLFNNHRKLRLRTSELLYGGKSRRL